MIKAYTFENGEAHDAKTDARIRRDLFFGVGNVIITGNDNGTINEGRVLGTLGGAIEFKTSNSATFIAGGRLFTMSETIRLNTEISRFNEKIAFGKIYFDIDTKESAGDFVKMVNSPSYGSDFEADKFSVTYVLAIVEDGGLMNVYASIDQNGHFNAGGSINITYIGKNTNGTPATYRGQTTTRGDLRLTKRGKHLTLTGSARDIKISSNSIEFTNNSKGHYSIEAESGTGTIMWSGSGSNKGGIATGEVKTASDNYLCKIENLEIVNGSLPTSLDRVYVLVNINGKILNR